MRILLVEDDEVFTQILVNHLVAQRYAVDVATDGLEGLNYALAASYGLIVLDVNLPKLDGIRLCQRLRQERYSAPILLLTAKGDSSDKVMGLDAGADDYVVKPCTVEELSARIRALLRRQNMAGTPILEWGNLRLDPGNCEVTYNGQLISLSPKEYRLLELFLRNPQRVFSSAIILEHLWGFEDMPGEETVRTHIKRLRRKLKAVGIDDIIDTVYGIGYRLTPAVEAPAPLPPSPQDEARAAAIAAWEQFKPPTMERVAVLEQALAALAAGNLPEDLRRAAEGSAHKLAGSLAMFGFPAGTQLGRDIECWFQTAAAGDERQVRSLVASLQQLLQQQPVAWDTEEPAPLSVLSPVEPGVAAHRVLVVDDDGDLTHQLQFVSNARGFRIDVATDTGEARLKLAQQVPDILLLDLNGSSISEDGLEFLAEVTAQYPSLRVLAFSTRDEFSDRLSVARRGSYRFISKATPLPQVLETIDDILHNQRSSEVLLLVVDDDPLILDKLKQCLPRWGIQAVTLNDSREIWKALETLTPDLLILDIDMPHVNGIEICQVIRNDSAWSGLPILFLTAHRDTETLLQIYSAGADDYVAKPFTEPELITRIFNRLERNRLLQNLADTDQLTGVATRQRSTKALNRYLRLAQQHHQPLCVAVITLDQFKQINEQYGHDIGDLLLKRFATIMHQQFQGEDVVGRWSGAEFLVGMYGVSKSQAVTRLNSLSDVIRREKFPIVTTSPLRITFSAGVAESPGDGTDLSTLYQAADTAMRQAKSAGSDRVILA